MCRVASGFNSFARSIACAWVSSTSLARSGGRRLCLGLGRVHVAVDVPRAAVTGRNADALPSLVIVPIGDGALVSAALGLLHRPGRHVRRSYQDLGLIRPAWRREAALGG